MPVNIISNSALSYLKQINKKIDPDGGLYDSADDFGIGPAYIVEISAKGRRLQQEHPVKIVRILR